MGQKIFIGSDHAGYKLKNKLKSFLKEEGLEVVDKGPEEYQETDDYPEYILKTAESVKDNKNALGVVLGHSGQGEALAANKVDGVRAALYYGGEPKIVELSKKHNNANVLSLGAGFLSENQAKQALKNWLETDFTDKDRHKRRLREISMYENKSNPSVLPALLAGSQEKLDREVEKVINYSKTFHVDIEDGSFVDGDSMSFDFNLPSYQRYEAHLMVENPLDVARERINDFQRFTFHVEAVEKPDEVIDFLKDEGKQAGIAIRPDTPLDKVLPFAHRADLVQVMTVEPGKYGSEFHKEMISRVRKLRNIHPSINIEVDGHVTPDTIEDLRRAGANIFVSGSYVQKSHEPGRAVRELEDIVQD